MRYAHLSTKALREAAECCGEDFGAGGWGGAARGGRSPSNFEVSFLYEDGDDKGTVCIH